MQTFLSCMAFSVYEVVRVACLSRSWLVSYPQIKTDYATDKRRILKTHERENTLPAGSIEDITWPRGNTKFFCQC